MSQAKQFIQKYWKVFISLLTLIVSAFLFKQRPNKSTTKGSEAAADNTREQAIKNQVDDSKTVNAAIDDLNERKPKTDKPPSEDDNIEELVDRYNKL